MFVMVWEPPLRVFAIIRQLFQRKKVIGTSADLYNFCCEKLSVNKIENQREFAYVQSKQIQREWPNSLATTVIGTRKIHCSRNIPKDRE